MSELSGQAMLWLSFGIAPSPRNTSIRMTCMFISLRSNFVDADSKSDRFFPFLFFFWLNGTFVRPLQHHDMYLPVWLKGRQYYIETCQLVRTEKANIPTGLRFWSSIYTRRLYYTEQPWEIAFMLQLGSPWCLLLSFHASPNLAESKLRGGNCVVINPNVWRARSLFGISRSYCE